MSYPEALDEVARTLEYQNFEDYNNSESDYDYLQYAQEQAAILYARSKWDEACEAQIESCLSSARVKYISCGDPMTCGCQGHCDHPTGIINRDSIKEAPKPEFKP